MTTWPEAITCPECSADTPGPAEIRTDCGKATGDCRCPECGHGFAAPEVEYWALLGLSAAPPAD